MGAVKLLKTTNVVEKNGETKKYTNFWIELSNGFRIAVKPSFSKDYKSLVVVASFLTETQTEDEKENQAV